jgi:hypothetical protein
MPRHLLAGLAAAAALAACAPNTTDRVKHEYAGAPPLGAPILDADLPLGAWTWVDFPDTSCGDGSPTGLGIDRGAGPDLLFFLDGGGACWSWETCAAGTAIDKSYGPSRFAAEVSASLPGSILDRAQLPPTLQDATLVFVPYCTGDVHGGDAVQTYTAPLASDTWHHVGHENLKAFLKRVGATWPAPRKVVVTGSSAGGFGALANYEAFRWYWPAAQGYLVDDSGPPLVGDDIPAGLRGAWYDAWNLGVALDAFCVDCRTDLSDAVAQLAQAHRGDRIAFLSHTSDQVMTWFLMQPTGFGAALARLEATRFAPTANARVFYTAGTQHMLLPTVGAQQTGTTTLGGWLEAMVSDSPSWATVVP